MAGVTLHEQSFTGWILSQGGETFDGQEISLSILRKERQFCDGNPNALAKAQGPKEAWLRTGSKQRSRQLVNRINLGKPGNSRRTLLMSIQSAPWPCRER